MRAVCGKWQSRLRITDESFTLMVRFLINGHMKKLAPSRRKLDKALAFIRTSRMTMCEPVSLNESVSDDSR